MKKALSIKDYINKEDLFSNIWIFKENKDIGRR